MKITHIALTGPVTDHWTYQDNLLPKYHKMNGYDVSMITSQYIYNSEGKIIKDNRDLYINENGVKTIRLKTVRDKHISCKFKKYMGLYECLQTEKPDILFIHTIQFIDIKTIVKYIKKHPNVKVYIDNHADFANSASNWISKNILHKIIWKHYAKLIEPYVTKFYGVLPARVNFLKEGYGLPEDKLDLLVMGADDEKVYEAQNNGLSDAIRKQYSKPNNFLIITGGKIDSNKTQTLLLMQAINNLNDTRVKLLVFGSIAPELKDQFYGLLSDRVVYAGWVAPKDVYIYFNAADLVIFPGLHSVFWELVVGLGKPCVFKYIDGFTHVDLGGNCKFIYQESIDEIEKIVKEIVSDEQAFQNMRKVAIDKGMDVFSYKKIAQKSIEI